MFRMKNSIFDPFWADLRGYPITLLLEFSPRAELVALCVPALAARYHVFRQFGKFASPFLRADSAADNNPVWWGGGEVAG